MISFWKYLNIFVIKKETQNVPCMIINAEVAQWVRALAPQAEGWVFVSQTRQTKVVKSSKGINFQPYVGSGDVSIWGKNSWDDKPQENNAWLYFLFRIESINGYLLRQTVINVSKFYLLSYENKKDHDFLIIILK